MLRVCVPLCIHVCACIGLPAFQCTVPRDAFERVHVCYEDVYLGIHVCACIGLPAFHQSPEMQIQFMCVCAYGAVCVIVCM